MDRFRLTILDNLSKQNENSIKQLILDLHRGVCCCQYFSADSATSSKA